VPAYACTINKSQGSEYTAVVFPLLTQHYAMLQRNLVYTGITRQRQAAGGAGGAEEGLGDGRQESPGAQALHQARGVAGVVDNRKGNRSPSISDHPQARLASRVLI
jgi:hypothetical protein